MEDVQRSLTVLWEQLKAWAVKMESTKTTNSNPNASQLHLASTAQRAFAAIVTTVTIAQAETK